MSKHPGGQQDSCQRARVKLSVNSHSERSRNSTLLRAQRLAKTCLNSRLSSRWLIIHTNLNKNLNCFFSDRVSLHPGGQHQRSACKNMSKFCAIMLINCLHVDFLLSTDFTDDTVSFSRSDYSPTDLHGFTQIHASLRSRGRRRPNAYTPKAIQN